ncbi:phosphotransferase family protein [Micromonospora sp. URMC 106]|uniref:phosphotransferase family protein n=1 Tax=Micromonospora sp. URMC 106 TaxID=3423408 RepID=UPI003F1960DD
MIDRDEAAAVPPLTLAWVSRHLEVGERIVRTEPLHGGITAEMRRLTIGARDGSIRELVLRSFVDPSDAGHAEDWLHREADALSLLKGTAVPAPELVAADPTAADCEYPSLLMTHLAGRTVLEDEGLEARVPLLARQLVAIHAVRPAERPREYVASTTADCTARRGVRGSPRRMRRPAGCWPRPRASGCTGGCGTRWRAQRRCRWWRGHGERRGGQS